MQVHNFDFVVDGTPEEVWDVIWKRTRVGVKTDTVTIEIYHPGDEEGNGLVRHCHFPVPRYLCPKGAPSRGSGSPRPGVRCPGGTTRWASPCGPGPRD